jgi:hypothetical protein
VQVGRQSLHAEVDWGMVAPHLVGLAVAAVLAAWVAMRALGSCQRTAPDQDRCRGVAGG